MWAIIVCPTSCMPFTDARVLAVDASIAPRASVPIELVSGSMLEKASGLNVANGKVKGEVVVVMMIIHSFYVK